MNTEGQSKSGLRTPSPAEVATVVRMFRSLRGWSQETLAVLSGLQPRTVQRVEAGERSSADTRRALARAFGSEDLDLFDRPIDLPSAEELETRRVEFDRTHLALDVEKVDGRALAALVVDMSDLGAVGSTGIADLPPAPQESFAAILDFVRDMMDVREFRPQCVDAPLRRPSAAARRGVGSSGPRTLRGPPEGGRQGITGRQAGISAGYRLPGGSPRRCEHREGGRAEGSLRRFLTERQSP